MCSVFVWGHIIGLYTGAGGHAGRRAAQGHVIDKYRRPDVESARSEPPPAPLSGQLVLMDSFHLSLFY